MAARRFSYSVDLTAGFVELPSGIQVELAGDKDDQKRFVNISMHNTYMEAFRTLYPSDVDDLITALTYFKQQIEEK